MRVIDLLNKIANGEEVPKKIVYHSLTGDRVWEFENNCQVEYGYKMTCFCDKTSLNVEVEVMGEDPEDEEIVGWSNTAIKEMRKEKNLSEIKKYLEVVMRTQNEIIKKINKD